MHITENLLQLEIVTPCNCGINAHITAKYFIAFTVKCFALTVAAISAELRAILLCKILQFLCRLVHSAHKSQFCARRIAEF